MTERAATGRASQMATRRDDAAPAFSLAFLAARVPPRVPKRRLGASGRVTGAHDVGGWFAGSAASGGGLKDLVAVAGVGGVEVDAGLDDLVDAVEDRRVEQHVSGGQLALELLEGARPDDGRGHRRVVDHEGDRELDERYAGAVGDPGELLDGLELALVLGQRHVEARRQSLSRG